MHGELNSLSEDERSEREDEFELLKPAGTIKKPIRLSSEGNYVL